MTKTELEKAKTALEKRERILNNLTNEKNRLIELIKIHDKNYDFISKIRVERELYDTLKKVGMYNSRVDFYKWKISYFEREVQK